jgi:hypothetical protein
MPESGVTSSAAPDAPVNGPSAQVATPVGGEDEAIVPRDVPLPKVETPLPPEAIVERLAFASRRGRLAGFEAAQGGGLFGVAAFGQPFDRVLIAEVERGDGGSTLEFRSALLKKWPVIFIVVTLFTIWPGVWLTNSLFITYFPSYPWWGVQTWMWYLPLTVLPLPWMVKSMWRKSEAAAHDSAHRAIRKIAAEIGGRIV